MIVAVETNRFCLALISVQDRTEDKQSFSKTFRCKSSTRSWPTTLHPGPPPSKRCAAVFASRPNKCAVYGIRSIPTIPFRTRLSISSHKRSPCRCFFPLPAPFHVVRPHLHTRDNRVLEVRFLALFFQHLQPEACSRSWAVAAVLRPPIRQPKIPQQRTRRQRTRQQRQMTPSRSPLVIPIGQAGSRGILPTRKAFSKSTKPT